MVDGRSLSVVALLLIAVGTAECRRMWVWLDPPTQTGSTQVRLAAEIQALDPHRARRLARTRKPGALLGLRDLPVAEERITALEGQGFRVRHDLPWISAVSGEGSPEALAAVEALPFVRRLTPVGRWTQNAQVDSPALSAFGSASTAFADVLEALGVPRVHEACMNGQGINVAILDTGFDMRHPAIAHAPVIAERDFINDDGYTGYEPSDVETCDPPCTEIDTERKQVFHGTAVASLVVGIDAEGTGEPIGPAHGASLLLAKTENNFQETRVEEDDWAAAVFWAETHGADVVTSSLGYLTFDAGVGDYDPLRDLDGRTTVCALAAVEAARRGVIVCTAMGNDGPGSQTLVTPADADSILAVGATQLDGSIASFSSRGPTSDDRMKPDLAAPGVYLRVANHAYGAGLPGAAPFVSFSGTSGATPLVAGVAALALQAHPAEEPLDVRARLLASGDRSQVVGLDLGEDNKLGYGTPSATIVAGLEGIGPGEGPCSPVVDPPQPLAIRVFPQPWRATEAPQLNVSIDMPVPGDVTLGIYNASGICVRRLSAAGLPAGPAQVLPSLGWNGANGLGQAVASGTYRLVLTAPSGTAFADAARIR